MDTQTFAVGSQWTFPARQRRSIHRLLPLGCDVTLTRVCEIVHDNQISVTNWTDVMYVLLSTLSESGSSSSADETVNTQPLSHQWHHRHKALEEGHGWKVEVEAVVVFGRLWSAACEWDCSYILYGLVTIGFTIPLRVEKATEWVVPEKAIRRVRLWS